MLLRQLFNVGCAAASIFLLGLPAAGAEFFGQFSAGPRGEFIDADPRPKFRLTEEFTFTDPNGLEWTVPAAAEVDGASIPQVFWSFIGGPFEGPYLKASIVHDHFCKTKERTAHDTHRDFYYGMRANNVPSWKAYLMHWAVATFGPTWTVQKRVSTDSICSGGGESLSCRTIATVADVPVVPPGPDLSDPEVLAIALAKFTAVARTLRTTDGASLDVGPTGVIAASDVSIEANAAALREALTARTYRSDPAVLGILSEVQTVPLDAVPLWTGGELPVFSAAPRLEEVDRSPDGQTAFRLGPGDLPLIEKQIDLAPQSFDWSIAPAQQ